MHYSISANNNQTAMFFELCLKRSVATASAMLVEKYQTLLAITDKFSWWYIINVFAVFFGWRTHKWTEKEENKIIKSNITADTAAAAVIKKVKFCYRTFPVEVQVPSAVDPEHPPSAPWADQTTERYVSSAARAPLPSAASPCPSTPLSAQQRRHGPSNQQILSCQ